MSGLRQAFQDKQLLNLNLVVGTWQKYLQTGRGSNENILIVKLFWIASLDVSLCSCCEGCWGAGSLPGPRLMRLISTEQKQRNLLSCEIWKQIFHCCWGWARARAWIRVKYINSNYITFQIKNIKIHIFDGKHEYENWIKVDFHFTL